MLPNGECVSVDGTHLGHNLPDRSAATAPQHTRSNASSRHSGRARAVPPRLEAPSRSRKRPPSNVLSVGLLQQSRGRSDPAYCSPGASPPDALYSAAACDHTPAHLLVDLVPPPSFTLSGYCVNLVSVPAQAPKGPSPSTPFWQFARARGLAPGSGSIPHVGRPTHRVMANAVRQCLTALSRSTQPPQKSTV